MGNEKDQEKEKKKKFSIKLKIFSTTLTSTTDLFGVTFGDDLKEVCIVRILRHVV